MFEVAISGLSDFVFDPLKDLVPALVSVGFNDTFDAFVTWVHLVLLIQNPTNCFLLATAITRSLNIEA